MPINNLDIQDGEFVVFVGPSGCGKSTLLRMISGLEDLSRGVIEIDGTDVTAKLPSERELSMVFQSYALYPHMSVGENIGFALKTAGLSKSDINSKVAAAAEVLELTDYLDRRPKDLSGGQRQRMAIGRAIVREPKAFLFDEPLSNLDASLRVQMRFEISKLHDTLKTSMIYVTHDQVEAMTLADKIVVLKFGEIMQVGSPRDLYENPDNLFVAQFIGSPKMNIIDLQGAETKVLTRLKKVTDVPDQATTLGVRPEHLVLSTAKSSVLNGVVEFIEYLGADTFLYLRLANNAQVLVRTSGTEKLDVGDTAYLTMDAQNTHFFDVNEAAIRS